MALMSANKHKKALIRKKRLREREKRLRRIGQRLVGSKLPELGKATIISNPPGVEKMSDVLDQFVAPYVDPGASEERFRKLLDFAVLAWNAALMPREARERAIDEAAETFPPDMRADFRYWMNSFIERKLAYFADNQRMILSFRLTMRGLGRPVLQVVSSLPEEK
jgi:hypothetical protein